MSKVHLYQPGFFQRTEALILQLKNDTAALEAYATLIARDHEAGNIDLLECHATEFSRCLVGAVQLTNTLLTQLKAKRMEPP